MIEQRIKELIGHELSSTPPKPLATYIPAQISGNLVFTSGQLPFKDGKLIAEGKVGYDVSEEKGIECARIAAINCLSAIKSIVKDLNNVEQIVKLTVYVNSAPGFREQPKIANGASDFLASVFGDIGKHARSAVGVNELPMNSPVEVEMIARVLSLNF
jgi:enamine deaminase RidA (YjgF/YER057c/UK114 family)